MRSVVYVEVVVKRVMAMETDTMAAEVFLDGMKRAIQSIIAVGTPEVHYFDAKTLAILTQIISGQPMMHVVHARIFEED